MSDVTLSAEELKKLTGYSQPARQLEELHRLGFWRARRLPISGSVALERVHYEAVSTGADQHPTAKGAKRAPQLRAA